MPWLSGIGNELVVGAAGGPQVILDSALNLPVTTQMPSTLLAASDVASISNLQNVIRMPTAGSGETSPNIAGPVLVTYTDGSQADGFLTMSGFYATGAEGSFMLLLSDSNTTSKPFAQLTGQYNIVAGTVILVPEFAATGTQLYGLNPGDATIGTQAPGDGKLIPAAESWHSLGTLAGYAVTEGRYRIAPGPRVEIEVDVTAGGANAGTVAFSNAMPALYRPLIDKRMPIASTRAVNLATVWPRLFVGAATGQVQIVQDANTAASLSTVVAIPLD